MDTSEPTEHAERHGRTSTTKSRPVLTVVAIVALLLFLGYKAFDAAIKIGGFATPYCPASHQTTDLATCCILDQQGGRVFIQHSNLDTNVYYWEIRSATASNLFQLPADVTQLAPQGYAATLIEDDSEHVLYRGERYTLEPMPTKPGW